MNDDFSEQGDQVSQLGVRAIIRPRLDENARVFLQDEVLGDVVYNDRFQQRTSDLRQIFDDNRERVRLRSVDCVLAVQPVRDQLAVRVELVDDPVSVLLDTRREDDDLVELRHFLKEFVAKRSYQKVGLTGVPIVHIVDQSFVQV